MRLLLLPLLLHLLVRQLLELQHLPADWQTSVLQAAVLGMSQTLTLLQETSGMAMLPHPVLLLQPVAVCHRHRLLPLLS